MKVIPFVLASTAPAVSAEKAPRLSCCCRISELIPLLRRMHETTRAAHPAPVADTLAQAA